MKLVLPFGIVKKPKSMLLLFVDDVDKFISKVKSNCAKFVTNLKTVSNNKRVAPV
jgi:hypothetical protein